MIEQKELLEVKFGKDKEGILFTTIDTFWKVNALDRPKIFVDETPQLMEIVKLFEIVTPFNP